jgi:hypothetical protein
MGCDIHAYIEMYNTAGEPFANCFAENISFGRDYRLFGLFAGVRSLNHSNMMPKGIPTSPQMSYTCCYHYYLNVCDCEGNNHNHFRYSDRCVSRQEAERMVADRGAKYVDAEKTMITDPDLHSATYLCLAELMDIRKKYLLDTVMYESELSGKKRKSLAEFIESKNPRTLMQYSFPEHDSLALYATIKTMMALESCSGEGGEYEVKTRLVCWFDS